LILSPLRSIPGPWYAAITSYYLILRDLAGQRTKTIHRLHEIYGPVVRIGPNEVSFSSGAVVKELYGQTSNYLKAPIYEAFLPGLFSLLDREKHRERRRYLSHVFSMNHLQNVEPVIQENVMLLLEGIASKGENSVNVMEWFKMFALDVTGLRISVLFADF
jgi:cytochrome P450